MKETVIDFEGNILTLDGVIDKLEYCVEKGAMHQVLLGEALLMILRSIKEKSEGGGMYL